MRTTRYPQIISGFTIGYVNAPATLQETKQGGEAIESLHLTHPFAWPIVGSDGDNISWLLDGPTPTHGDPRACVLMWLHSHPPQIVGLGLCHHHAPVTRLIRAFHTTAYNCDISCLFIIFCISTTPHVLRFRAGSISQNDPQGPRHRRGLVDDTLRALFTWHGYKPLRPRDYWLLGQWRCPKKCSS